MQHPDLLETIQNGGLKLDPDKNVYLERSKYSQSPEKSIESFSHTSKSDTPPPMSLQKIFESQAIRSILENLSKISDENKVESGEEGKESERENDNEKENEVLKKIGERDEEMGQELENENENSDRSDKNIEKTLNTGNTIEEKDSENIIKVDETENKDNEVIVLGKENE